MSEKTETTETETTETAKTEALPNGNKMFMQRRTARTNLASTRVKASYRSYRKGGGKLSLRAFAVQEADKNPAAKSWCEIKGIQV